MANSKKKVLEGRDAEIATVIEQMLVVENDAHWVDGKPNLKMLQEALGDDLTAADVERVTEGLDREGIARGRGIIFSAAPAAPVNEAEVIRTNVRSAEDEIADLDAALGDNISKRQQLQKELDDINDRRDRLLRLVSSGAQVSTADAVKAIQAQSMKAAQERKAAIQHAADSMRAAGIKPQFASPLDQHLAQRPRTQQHASAHATFIAQQAAERNAARG